MTLNKKERKEKLKTAICNLKKYGQDIPFDKRLELFAYIQKAMKAEIKEIPFSSKMETLYSSSIDKIIKDIDTFVYELFSKDHQNRSEIKDFCSFLKKINPPKIIKKKKSSLELFQEANDSFNKSVKTFLSFVNSVPALSKENKMAIISGLFAPQWVKKVTYNEMRIALVRACWEKMCLYPQKNKEVRQSINDLTEYAFYAQKKNNIEMLSKLGKIMQALFSESPLYEPRKAQAVLRQSNLWGTNKAISLVLAPPGRWQKMTQLKKLSKDKRVLY